MLLAFGQPYTPHSPPSFWPLSTLVVLGISVLSEFLVKIIHLQIVATTAGLEFNGTKERIQQ